MAEIIENEGVIPFDNELPEVEFIPLADDFIPEEFIPEDLEEIPKPVDNTKQLYCMGLNIYQPRWCFTQDNNYCDAYLRSKGLLQDSPGE